MPQTNGHFERILVEDRVDLFNADGVYIFSLQLGKYGLWREVINYKDSTGQERIGSIKMTMTPDWLNSSHMNLKECPFCKGRSSTCEDCMGSGWIEDLHA